jgi:hypothetical protein
MVSPELTEDAPASGTVIVRPEGSDPGDRWSREQLRRCSSPLNAL